MYHLNLNKIQLRFSNTVDLFKMEIIFYLTFSPLQMVFTYLFMFVDKETTSQFHFVSSLFQFWIFTLYHRAGLTK